MIRKENYSLSLDHLNTSVEYNEKIKGDEVNLSGTHLNMCALQSKIGE